MATNEELQAELAELRGQVALLTASLAPRKLGDVPSGLSRRNLLRAAPVAAIGAGLAAFWATPAAAASGQPVLLGEGNDAGAGTTTVLSGGTTYESGTNGAEYFVTGIPGESAPALQTVGGVKTDWLQTTDVAIGMSNSACVTVIPYERLLGLYVQGGSITRDDPHADEDLGAALFETEGPGTGLEVRCTDGWAGEGPTPDDYSYYPGNGVVVTTATGVAFTGTSQRQVFRATSTDATSSVDAATLSYAGKGRAFYAESTATTNINGTVTGVNDGVGIGVWGENKNTTAAGIGVVGVGNKAGRGAQFSGGVAQARFVPGTASTHPTAGKAGDFYVDSANRLWFCQKASTSSAAATWKQLA